MSPTSPIPGSPLPAPQSKRQRVAALVARVLLGLLLVANAPVGTLIPTPPSSPAGDALIAALWGSPFIMVLTKVVELGVGLLLLSNRFVALGLVVLAPVVVNIVAFEATFSPQALPLGAVLVLLGGYLAWVHRAAYAPLLRSRAVFATTASPMATATAAGVPSEARV